MIMRVCPGAHGSGCGTLIASSQRRCPEHAREAARRPRRPSAWDALARRMVRTHLRTGGPYCPGDPPDHDAHPSFDLTVDHRVRLVDGGAMLDPANLRILCRAWNGHLGGRGDR